MGFFLEKYVKSQGQGHKDKIFAMERKVLSQEIHLFYMTALTLVVKKLWPRLSLF